MNGSAVPMSSRSDNTREVASYIAALTAELAQIAGEQRLDLLRYLLEMARQEARSIALGPGGGEE